MKVINLIMIAAFAGLSSASSIEYSSDKQQALAQRLNVDVSKVEDALLKLNMRTQLSEDLIP